MQTLFVGYDLNAPGKNYDNLIEYLKSHSGWCRPLESNWLIRTTKSHKTVRDEAKKFIDANDELLVIDVTGDAAAWYGLSDKVSTWLQENL